GIVIAGIVLLSVLAAAVVYVLHQRRKKRRESLDSGTPPSPTVPHSVPRESNPLTTVSVGTSPHTPPPTPVPLQDDGAAQVPVAEQPSKAVEQHIDPTNMEEVMERNSSPSDDAYEGSAANTTGNVRSANNNVHQNMVENMPMAYTNSPDLINQMVLNGVQNYVASLYAELMNGGG
ncbi:hypothetical protein DQ04_24101000, partial [Trypanosoma grayi]|uniref:hypothetical protein n=1 Tax=Trypanosoma grayi TaxID=71804 RepID=UPI0004F45E0F